MKMRTKEDNRLDNTEMLKHTVKELKEYVIDLQFEQ